VQPQQQNKKPYRKSKLVSQILDESVEEQDVQPNVPKSAPSHNSSAKAELSESGQGSPRVNLNMFPTDEGPRAGIIHNLESLPSSMKKIISD
jgi:hypothetical protein